METALAVEPRVLLHNFRAPLVEAICATVCSSWCEASDLWLEVYRTRRCRGLASQCGVQAALNAGLIDIAEYFYVGLDEYERVPDYIQSLWSKNMPVKEARVLFYSVGIQEGRNPARGTSGKDLMRLHLYREAIQVFLVSGALQSNPKDVAPSLARAYAMLGAHASLLGLYDAYRVHLDGTEAVALVERARRLVERQRQSAGRNLARFVEQHPAGPELREIERQLTDARSGSSST
jgi:hypothetical protein